MSKDAGHVQGVTFVTVAGVILLSQSRASYANPLQVNTVTIVSGILCLPPLLAWEGLNKEFIAGIIWS